MQEASGAFLIPRSLSLSGKIPQEHFKYLDHFLCHLRFRRSIPYSLALFLSPVMYLRGIS
jgi:hypothetical protein